MGILARAIFGGIGQAGDTAAQMMMEGYKAQLQSERDQANSVREANLLRLRQQLSDQSTEKSNALALSSSYDPDTGRQLTNKEAAEYDPDTLLGAEEAKQRFSVNPNYTLNGRPATNQQLMDNADANQNVKAVQDAIAARGKDAKATPEEQEILDSWKGDAGDVVNSKEAALEAKLENQKVLGDLKYQTLEKNAELRAQTALQVANLNYQHAVEVAKIRAEGGATSAAKEAQIAVKKAEEERKSANAAVLMLQNADMSDPANVRLFNKHMIDAGEPEGVKPVPAEKSQAAKKDDTGVFKKLRGLIGMADDSGSTPAKPAAAPQLSSGAYGQYNFSALPQGSEPVPGKFTKDGRPVFKTPKGQLVAPQLSR